MVSDGLTGSKHKGLRCVPCSYFVGGQEKFSLLITTCGLVQAQLPRLLGYDSLGDWTSTFLHWEDRRFYRTGS